MSSKNYMLRPTKSVQLLHGVYPESEDWIHVRTRVLPKQSRLEQVREKQILYKSRQSREGRLISRSFIDGYRPRANLDSYFHNEQKIGGGRGSNQEIYDEMVSSEEEIDINLKTDGNNEAVDSVSFISSQPKLPQLLVSGKKQSTSSSSLSLKEQDLKLPPIKESRGQIPSSAVPSKIGDKMPSEVAEEVKLNEGLLPAPTLTGDTKVVGGKGQDVKKKKLSKLDPSNSSIPPRQSSSVQRGGPSIQERFKGFIGSLKEVEIRLMSKIDADVQLKSGLQVLTGLKTVALGGLLVKLFRLCVEKIAQRLAAIQTKPLKIALIDPVASLKGLTLTGNLAAMFERFFQQELSRGEFSSEQDTFRFVFSEITQRYVLVDEILLSFGGVGSVQAIISVVAEKISQHFLNRPLTVDMRGVISKIGISFFQGSAGNLRDTLENLEVGLNKVKSADFFIVKHFIFEELARSDDNEAAAAASAEYSSNKQTSNRGKGGQSRIGNGSSSESLSWSQKCLLLEKMERLRYDFFRNIYQLPSEEDVNLSIRELTVQGNSVHLDFLLKEPSLEGRVNVLQVFANCFIGGGCPRNVIEELTKEGSADISVIVGGGSKDSSSKERKDSGSRSRRGSNRSGGGDEGKEQEEDIVEEEEEEAEDEERKEEKRNLLTKALISAEHLLNSSLSKCKNAMYSPRWAKKVLEIRFTELKRKLDLLVTKFEDITTLITRIISKLHVLVNRLAKIKSESARKKFADLRLFAQLLVEISQNGDTFAVEDLAEGIKFYRLEDAHFTFWIRALQRVLGDLAVPHDQAVNFVLLVKKLCDDAKMLLQ